MMMSFIDEQRASHGVESICRVLPIAPSTYFRRINQQVAPVKLSARARRDAELCPEIERVYDANFKVYGADKVCKQLKREGVEVARCTVERLMRKLGLEGVRRGKKVRTTIADTEAPCPLDRVHRQFTAARPNALWVADFTYGTPSQRNPPTWG